MPSASNDVRAIGMCLYVCVGNVHTYIHAGQATCKSTTLPALVGLLEMVDCYCFPIHNWKRLICQGDTHTHNTVYVTNVGVYVTLVIKKYFYIQIKSRREGEKHKEREGDQIFLFLERN